MMMQNKTDKIKDLIKPLFNQKGIYLVDIELKGHSNNQLLSIYADTATGITVQQITEISREISDILDIEDIIKGKYRLNISSPGIDRPITEHWQYLKNIGKKLSIAYRESGQILNRIGILTKIDEDHITLRFNDDVKTIPLSEVIKAVVKMNW